MTIYTFAEIAEFARTVEPSQKLGSINYCRMVVQLAEAMDRLEHNTAAALARISPHWAPQVPTEDWLRQLRAPKEGE